MTTANQEAHAQRNADIAKDYMENYDSSLSKVGENHGLKPDRVRQVIMEVTGLNFKEIAAIRAERKLKDVLARTNQILDEDEDVTRVSDLLTAAGISNDYLKANQEALATVVGRIKARRHIKDNKVSNKFSDEDIIEAIRSAFHGAQKAVSNGKEVEFKYFTMPLYEKYRDRKNSPTRATIVNRIGWNEACERIGEFETIKPRGTKPRFLKQDGLNAMEACATALGKPVELVTLREYDDWHRDNSSHPSVLTLRKMFDRRWANIAEAVIAGRGRKSKVKLAS